jgi:hypothetical protein
MNWFTSFISWFIKLKLVGCELMHKWRLYVFRSMNCCLT